MKTPYLPTLSALLVAMTSSADLLSTAGISDSYAPQLNNNGRYILFLSDAGTQVSNEANGQTDLFLWDAQTGNTELISANAARTASGNDFSWDGTMTPDGRYVVFQSDASDLVPGDTNGVSDVFLWDRNTGVTRLVSVDTNGLPANNTSWSPRVSDDGQFVAFHSWANDLVPGDTNRESDIFIRDMAADVTFLASKKHSDSRAGDDESDLPLVVSPDGRHVVFESVASDLVSGISNVVDTLFVRDQWSGVTHFLSPPFDGGPPSPGFYQSPAFSADGRYVVFSSTCNDLVPDDTNGVEDVFVRDLAADVTTLISANRTHTGSANGPSFYPSISGNGRYVAFESEASNLVTGDTNGVSDVFVRDRWTGLTSLISVNRSGSASGNDWSFYPQLNADGRFVVFDSLSTNLTSDRISPNTANVFLRDRLLGTTVLISTNLNGAGGIADDQSSLGWPHLSADGSLAVFENNTSVHSPNAQREVFVVRLDTASPTADLSVGLSATPRSTGFGGTLTYVATVTNLGPANATDVGITFWLPSGMTLVAASNSPGTNAAMRGAVVANPGILHAGSTATLTVQASATMAGMQVASVSATAAEPDLIPINNRARTITIVTNSAVGPELQYTILSHSQPRLLVAWPDSAVGFVLYETDSLCPPSRWLPVTNQAQIVNGFFTVTLEVGDGARFYRLVQPGPRSP